MNESKFHISVMKLNFLSSILFFLFLNTDVRSNDIVKFIYPNNPKLDTHNVISVIFAGGGVSGGIGGGRTPVNAALNIPRLILDNIKDYFHEKIL